MEVRRNNSRAVLGELKLSNSVNVEPSSRRTVKTTESHISPDSFKNAEPDGLISSVPKSTTHLSNLELLTKVASRVTSNNASCFNSENAANSFQPKESVDINCKPRKEKSLSILCDKFLKLYPLNVSPGKFMEISLDQATQFIGTDRRRIYDILIVLECLQMASKVCKNHYQWHGTQHLTGTLSQLKWLALRLNFLQNVNSVLMEKSSGLYDDCSSEVENADLNVMDPSTISAHAQNVMTGHNNLTPSSMSVFTSAIGSSSNQKPEDEADFDLKDSSLGIMCQKFLMLFLVTSKVITLDNAAKILLGDTEGVSKDCHKVKTKIRRLYDIANVLSSLELIKKVNISGNAVTFGSFIRLSKKPAFQYIGPDVQPKPLPNDALSLQTTRHSLLGHPSHAACEKKSSRKRKLKGPCPLLPKPGNILKECVNTSDDSSFGDKRARLSPGAIHPNRDKFPRSHSETCLSETPQRCGALRSDILQVAELELKRIADEEQQQKEITSKKPIKVPVVRNSTASPKCNWKHYHSENCISVDNGVNKNNAGKNIAPKVVSWKSSILKNSDAVLNGSSGSDLKLSPKVVGNPQWKTFGSSGKDVSICIINSSSITNKLEGKFKAINGKATVPVVIHSMHKTSRLRSICVNPVPISGANCIVGPAYIIHQLPSSGTSSFNPVSVRVTGVERESSNDSLGGVPIFNNVVSKLKSQ
ncbi:transcription factor E2F8-like isoform X2 [Ischnura elegans]|uniref:transcription factor E2F8-like isoform X2 n=1 Tax=Ischnura elegans TaxID=197161 RepID=UPI001ED89B4C|nr:transcription factor E2F8-like isoform X2 [Ischnura elegans]